MSERYRPAATVWLLDPFHARVHEVLPRVSRNASVKYRAPDCSAMVVIASEVHVSKYGAYTCAGIGTAAVAVADPESAGPANAANATSVTTAERARCITTASQTPPRSRKRPRPSAERATARRSAANLARPAL